MTVDPGATPVSARAPAPDLARGGMLLLIALANVHFYVHGDPIGVRGYPERVVGVDQPVVLLQMMLVDGRAYPLFGLLFGYGIGQLASRRSAVGLPAAAVTGLVRRRGAWMIVIGLLHGVLLWSGDIVGAYGLLAVLLAGLLVRGTDRGLLVTTAVGVVFLTLVSSVSGLTVPGEATALLPSMTIPDPGAAAAARAVEWITSVLLGGAIGAFGAVAFGSWAARRRLLDEPERHRTLLTRTAIGGIGLAALGGLPLALMAAQLWTAPPIPMVLLAGSLHALTGYAGGFGYAALFGLLAVRIARRGAPGTITRAVRACGQRSLSCYLAQSVAFVALLPAWTLGLGEQARLWQVALVAIGVWLVILLVAAVSDRLGHRGPAETLLRRLTYGRAPGSRADSGDSRATGSRSSDRSMTGPLERERPSWMGAPGYTPAPQLPPHAPMPGAPPYPAPVERPATPTGGPAPVGTTLPIALAATAVWAVVNVLLVILGPGPVSVVRLGAGVLISTLLAVLISWWVARRRTWSFWVLLAVTAPVYWVLRAVVSALFG